MATLLEPRPSPVHVVDGVEPTYDPFLPIDIGIRQNAFAHPSDISMQLPVIGRTGIFETPQEVRNSGEVLTNPSQPIIIRHNGEFIMIASFRRELKGSPSNPDAHLGTTVGEMYRIVPMPDGSFRLVKYEGATLIIGEDVRLKTHIAVPGRLRNHVGYGASSIEATPNPNALWKADIRQLIWWGERLDCMEVVAEIRNNKGDCFAPVVPGELPIHNVGRPHPNLTYKKIGSGIVGLDENALDGCVLTEEMADENSEWFKASGMAEVDDEPRLPFIHHGVNDIRVLPDGLIALDAHHAYSPLELVDPRTGLIISSADGVKSLNYCADDWVISPENRSMHYIGRFATRQDFPAGESKPPSPTVNYDNIVYGARGRLGRMVGGLVLFGLNDTQAGWAIMAPPQHAVYYRWLRAQDCYRLAA